MGVVKVKIVEIAFPNDLKSEKMIILSDKICINTNYTDSNSLANSINLFNFSGEMPLSSAVDTTNA